MEPLPPVKEVEYRCIIGKDYDEILEQDYTTFSFETAKEFSSFRYEIAVRYKLEGSNIFFRVLGMTATRMMMPAFGTAQSVLKVPQLQPGRYTVTFSKSDSNESVFFLDVTKKGIQVGKPIPRKRFIDILIKDEAAAHTPKSIISTVSKAPQAPLVPRTIQKRPPPTPEELEILAALRDETPEERDAREELELFGKRRATKAKPSKNAKAKPVKKKAAKVKPAKKKATATPKPKKGKGPVKKKPAPKKKKR